MIIDQLSQRKATFSDLAHIVHLLADDALGSQREQSKDGLDKPYFDAFHRIDADPNQYLMVVLKNNQIVGTCHLTLMPSLTFQGSTRMHIEAVRVAKDMRGQKIGEWMMVTAIEYAKSHGVAMIQLTTNIKRPRAKNFYEQLGFQATHVGMKLYL